MTIWILDKSAHARLITGASIPAGIDSASLTLCEMGELEWLYSARSGSDYEDERVSIRQVYPVLAAPPDVFERVRRLQRDLASHRGLWHRTPIPDLFIAETALHHGAGVLHVNRDYARIAEVRAGLWERELD